jgi:hypothetical protein
MIGTENQVRDSGEVEVWGQLLSKEAPAAHRPACGCGSSVDATALPARVQPERSEKGARGLEPGAGLRQPDSLPRS